ncbi:MAG: tryptophanyl-tRNA synthetase [Candidatus Saccharimonadales bacterium]|jgi:tryptophanyl-tRNA synthetase
MSKQIVLTGIRSNDEPTLGNYIGAFKPMSDMAKKQSKDYNVHMFVPDLHSFTTPIEFGKFYERTMHNLRLFVACGLPLDNDSIFIYRQSFVPAHSELTWILDNFTGFGELSRMVEFKDKSTRLDTDRVSVGLFNYPVLMSADILLYGATWVPVGEDQRQHLEFTRTIAERLNNKFNLSLVVPETIENQQKFVGRSEAPRIRSLRNPSKKMSKSIDDPAGTILLSDTPESASKKIMSAETDNLGKINYDWQNQPGVTNLLAILGALTDQPQKSVNAEWVGKERYGDLKKAVSDVLSNFLQDLQTKLSAVDDEALIKHLEASETRMNIVANETLLTIQKAIGLRI